MPLTTKTLETSFPIVQTLTPALPVGVVCYFQTGVVGAGKGLLLALTNTPSFVKMLMTNSGLQRIS